MRKAIFLIILVLMSTAVSAEMRLFGFTKERYNLGDSLLVSFSIRAESDFNGLFKTALVCDAYSLEYFIVPMSLSVNEQRSVDVTPLQLTDKSFAGNCFIKSNLKPLFGNFSGEEFQSQNIVITEEIPLTVSLDKESFLPGETVTISGEAKTTHQDFQRASIQIMLDEKTFKYPLESRNFSRGYELGKNIKSGMHTISVSVEDLFGNLGSAESNFTVIPVPTKLANRMTKTELDPGEEMNFEVVLYDQADDAMPGKANTQILDPDQQLLFSAEQDTQKMVGYKLEQTAPPGTYSIVSISGSLKAVSSITVRSLKQIGIEFDKHYLSFKNTGNVVYRKEFNVIVKNGKEYAVPVKLELAPEEIYELDMFKQVPAGTYDIVVPKEDKYLVYEDVSLEDQRPLSKKTSMGLAAITGGLFGNSGEKGKKAGISPLIVVIVLIAIASAAGFFIYKKRAKKDKQKKLF